MVRNMLFSLDFCVSAFAVLCFFPAVPLPFPCRFCKCEGHLDLKSFSSQY